MVQIHAFQLCFRLGEGSVEQRFADAISMSCDEEFEKARRQRPELIERYKKEYIQRCSDNG